MQRISNDRRGSEKNVVFPLIDSDKNQVSSERRSGVERRKSHSSDDVAGSILNIIH